MNRQIIFRAKNDNGIWIYGCYTHPIDKYHKYPHSILITETPNGEEEARIPHKVVEMPINPDTLGQYTGVDDINGTRIFEGDIVRIHCNMGYDILGVVKFKDGCFGVYNESEMREFHPLNLTSKEDRDMGARIELEYTFEVLGNIFDDSQILAN